MEVGGDLGDQPVGADPHRHREPALLAHPAADLPRRPGGGAERGEPAGQVEVGLVERHGLHDGRQLAVDGEDLLRLLPVAPEVGRDEEHLRAEPLGAGGGHRRVDTEAPRLVARRRHHPAPLRLAADHHRPAGERGVVPHVDGGVEAVHVAVEDPAPAGIAGIAGIADMADIADILPARGIARAATVVLSIFARHSRPTAVPGSCPMPPTPPTPPAGLPGGRRRCRKDTMLWNLHLLRPGFPAPGAEQTDQAVGASCGRALSTLPTDSRRGPCSGGLSSSSSPPSPACREDRRMAAPFPSSPRAGS